MRRLFNLDSHVSVLSDVKDIFQKLYGEEVEITNWSISGDRWVFGFPYVNVKHITQRSWKNLNPEMIAAFQAEYDTYLSQFDGFIVTHTPAFALLFEKYNKPIIVVNSCRYNQPFCWNNDVSCQHLLNTSLKRMAAAKQLFIVSNNKADQEYLRLGTGLESTHIPSLCAYTKTTHNPTEAKEICLTYGYRERFLPCERLINKRNGSTWKEIYSCQAIFHAPYESSTMSLAEQYTAGVPLFLPSKAYYTKLADEGEPPLKSIYMKQCDDAFYDALEPTFDIQFWIDRADYYDEENMPYLYYYDSPEDAVEKATTFKEDPAVRAKRDAFLETRKAKILASWDTIFKAAFDGRPESPPARPAVWDQPDKEGFEMCSRASKGQINRGTTLGDMLYALAQDTSMKNFLEVGTWNGMGSTRCLATGIAQRPSTAAAELWSLECNADKASAARKLYNPANIHILQEVLFKGIPIDILQKMPDIQTNSDYNHWLQVDLQNMAQSQLFLERNDIPETFDFVLLDGGEFTTIYDFLVIKDLFKNMIVDNVSTFKGSFIKKYVEEHSDQYEILMEHPERNGFMFIRKKA
jgi:predicted O-methyltransferase YrrM